MARYPYGMGYQYDTNPRKLDLEYEPRTGVNSRVKTTSTNKNNKKVQNKKHLKPKARAVLYVLFGFAILFAISYRYSLITESFTQKEDLKRQLSVLQKENAQIEIGIQNSLNLSNVQNAAVSKLGMKKLDDMQKVYVNLPKKDYVEPASEQIIVVEDTQNWFEKLMDKIF